jgi:fumarate reductase subunit C
MRGGPGGTWTPGERTLRRPLPGSWVLTKGTWFVFFLREITSLFVAYFAIVLVCFARSVAQGPAAHEAFVSWLARPGVMAFHAFVFVAVTWHTVTWFVAAPKAMRPRVKGQTVPPLAVALGHYGAWLVVSLLVLWIVA